ARWREMAAGNGAAMRIAPLMVMIDPASTADRVLVRDVCRITHHSDEAYVGALAVLLALRATALSSDEVFGEIAGCLPDSRVRDRILEFAGEAGALSIPEAAVRFGSSGCVVETVPLAILVASRMTSETIESALSEIARVGDDADTIGAIAGQIAGFR